MHSAQFSKREQQTVLSIITQLKKDKNVKEFLKPVDYKGLGLFDYTLVIKRPMDIETVTKNIKAQKYRSFKECIKDINLIWQNCMTYNRENSGIYL